MDCKKTKKISNPKIVKKKTVKPTKKAAAACWEIYVKPADKQRLKDCIILGSYMGEYDATVVVVGKGRVFQVDYEACGCEIENATDRDECVQRVSSMKRLEHPSNFFREWGENDKNRSSRLQANYNDLVNTVVAAGCPRGMWPAW